MRRMRKLIIIWARLMPGYTSTPKPSKNIVKLPD